MKNVQRCKLIEVSRMRSVSTMSIDAVPYALFVNSIDGRVAAAIIILIATTATVDVSPRSIGSSREFTSFCNVGEKGT